jgi:hypothetical protein
MTFSKPTLIVMSFACFVYSLRGMEEMHNNKLMKIKDSSLFATHEVGKVDLFHSDEGFHVRQNDEVYPVSKHSVDPLLRTLKHKQLKKFQKFGYIQVKKNEDNEFSLVSKVRGNGGGPATGAALYWITKSLCWGTAIAATGTVVVATGGLAGAATGGLVAASTLGAGAGATVVAGSLAGAGLTAEAALVTGGVVAGAGSVAAAVATVEAASLGAFAVGLAIPFLP